MNNSSDKCWCCYFNCCCHCCYYCCCCCVGLWRTGWVGVQRPSTSSTQHRSSHSWPSG